MFRPGRELDFSVAQMLRIAGSESGVVLYHPSHPGQVQQSNDHDHGKMFGHDRTWTCTLRDGTRTRNVQIRGLMLNPNMPRAALPLSYMAGSILWYEEMTCVTMLQLVLEPSVCLQGTLIAPHWCWEKLKIEIQTVLYSWSWSNQRKSWQDLNLHTAVACPPPTDAQNSNF